MDGMNNLAGGDGPSHDGNMEARVAVLEEIAAAIKQGMVDLRQEVRDMSRRVEAVQAALESGFRTMQASHEGDFRTVQASQERDFRTVQASQERDFRALQAALERDYRTAQTARERDFRLLFGAIITVAIGLAALMGHGFHWF
jgi:hypothetical protein